MLYRADAFRPAYDDFTRAVEADPDDDQRALDGLLLRQRPRAADDGSARPAEPAGERSGTRGGQARARAPPGVARRVRRGDADPTELAAGQSGNVAALEQARLDSRRTSAIGNA